MKHLLLLKLGVIGMVILLALAPSMAHSSASQSMQQESASDVVLVR